MDFEEYWSRLERFAYINFGERKEVGIFESTAMALLPLLIVDDFTYGWAILFETNLLLDW